MKKVIEIFKWGYEGEYNQYFYCIEENKEEEFIKEANKYLRQVKSKEEFWWDDPLYKFKPHLRVSLDFGPNIVIGHLNGWHVIDETASNKQQKILLNHRQRGTK